MRVLSVVGARPQFVKLAPMAKALTGAGVEHVIVHTGQHYDVNMSDSFFKELGIPDPDIHLGVGSGSHGVQTGNMLAQLDPVFETERPDWVLVYGDTNSTIAAALAAVKLHLPLAHLEAGLRSFNRAMPEEHNRVLTDHAADLCLAPTEVALGHLVAEGLGDRSVVVGDVMVDVCLQVRDQVAGRPLTVPVDRDHPFVLATIHRAENTDDEQRLRSIIIALAEITVPVVLPVHPRLAAKATAAGISLTQGNIRTVDPLPYPALVGAAAAASGVVTDSGGLQKEAFLLGTPCTTVRTETEWVETLGGGWNILDPDASHVAQLAVRRKPSAERGEPFGRGTAAEAAVQALVEFNR